jgi:hypothetical protein
MTAARLAAPSRLCGLVALLCALVASSRTAAAEPARPHEAPILGTAPALPPLPPEYLTHEQGGIRFAYHPSARGRVRALIEEAEGVRAELHSILGKPVLGSIEVRVAMGGGDFARVLPQGAPQAAVAALSELHLVALSLRAGAASASDVRFAFRRGLAYLALDEAAGTDQLPRWLRVGFAISFSEEGELQRAHQLWWAAMQQHLLPIAELDWYLADGTSYDGVAAAQAADFVSFLMARQRAGAFVRLMAADAPTFDAALAAAYQEDLPTLESAWRAGIARHRGFVPILVAGTLLWLAVAVLSAWRRRRRAVARADRRRPVEPAPPPEAAVPAEKPRRAPPPLPQRPPLPDADVPKVSHNGRWHTLH